MVMGGSKLIAVDDAAVESGTRINSPRSLEACRRTGIDPEELLPKSPHDFWDRRGKYASIDKEAAALRFQHFEQLRQGKLQAVRLERDTLIQELTLEGVSPLSTTTISNRTPALTITTSSPARRAQSAGFTGSAGSSNRCRRALTASLELAWATNGDDREDLHEEATAACSTMVQREERRLQRLKLRQQKELQAAVEMEAKLARAAQEVSHRQAEEARAQLEVQKKARIARAARAAQKQARDRELQRQLEAEALVQRQRAKLEAEEQNRLREEERQRELVRKAEAEAREQERTAKAEAFRRQTEALLAQQEALVAANRERLQQKEAAVQLKLQQAARARAQEAEAKRLRAQERLQQAALQHQELRDARRAEFQAKQDAAQARAREIHQRVSQELQARAEQQRSEEAIRQQRLEAARRLQLEARDRILDKRVTLESKLEQVQREREREQLLLAVEKDLSQQEKAQNVARLQRVEAYQREQLQERIRRADAHSRAIKERKLALLQARAQVARDAFQRKHELHEAMEQLRQRNKWEQIDRVLAVKQQDAAVT